MERFDRIDVLVNNAGSVKRESVLALERSEWDRVIAVNLKGPVNLMHVVTPGMAARGYGRVVR